ncbi:pilus assembly protein Flp/PilA [Humibacillus xanthopallidus]|uniref:Pilus assembly protein Flp/PilA n=1 Tax=Humibacillus xanthopallidus TaxID=412689 RepID=A0A543PMD2_9MICO|nr:Flp family type IVb pilin [Humibacillus xanthopallidus]TQN45238.1 pilus assembly protein Flp/PilA [Humibacillus xanthopallidus]
MNTRRIVRRAQWAVREGGATAVEYALMASLVAIVIIAAVIMLGTNLSNFFNDAATKV